MNHTTFILLALLVFIPACSANSDVPQIIMDVSKPGAPISSTMYGVFFEDINFGADGGLYAELVKNRSFEFDRPLRGWRVIRKTSAEGRVLALRDENRIRNPRFIRILVDNTGEGFGLRNEGFRGMGIRKGTGYRFSIHTRKVKGNINAVRVELVDNKGKVLAKGEVNNFSNTRSV